MDLNFFQFDLIVSKSANWRLILFITWVNERSIKRTKMKDEEVEHD